MQIIKINPNDNVAVATRKLKNGEKIKIEGHEIIVKDDVEMGNKIAINNIDKEEKIYKYGNVIGVAQEKIKEGKFIHTHNMKTELKIQEKYEYAPIFDMNEDSSNEEYFSGYYRKDGTVGIRNEIWIIPTVGCVNSIGRKLAEIGKNVISGSIDGVYCWEHPYGCSQMGEDQENTKRIIKCLCEHGNAGGVLLVGLGCENLNLEVLDVTERTGNDKIIRAFNCQDVYDEVAEGTKLLEEIALGIKECERKPIPISKLRVGIKCGGSDGFSGITANPLIGNVVDVLVDSGASILMSEVPEMFGAERILMNRCCDDRVFNKLVRMINDFKEYYTKHKMPIYDNPSPGNKKGGITTLEEKSLGCIQKSGTSIIQDVLAYGEIIKKQGLNLVYAPGNDLVSMTALVAAGAHIVLFSTGRGTPVGAIVPTVKISSNTDLYLRKKSWIDYNAGELLNCKTIDDTEKELIEFIKQVASGKKRTCNEENNERSFAIFKTGVTL